MTAFAELPTKLLMRGFCRGQDSFHNIAALKAGKGSLADMLVKNAQVPLYLFGGDRRAGRILLFKPLLDHGLKGKSLLLLGKQGGFLAGCVGKTLPTFLPTNNGDDNVPDETCCDCKNHKIKVPQGFSALAGLCEIL